MREEINRVSILVGAKPPDDLEVEYDPMDFKLALPPPLPRLAATGSRRGSVATASSGEQPPRSAASQLLAIGASGAGLQAWSSAVHASGSGGMAYGSGAMPSQGAGLPRDPSAQFTGPTRVAHWQSAPLQLPQPHQPSGHVSLQQTPAPFQPPTGGHRGWATLADYGSVGATSHPLQPSNSYERYAPAPSIQMPDHGAFRAARLVPSPTPSYYGPSVSTAPPDHYGPSSSYHASLRPPDIGGSAQMAWPGSGAPNHPPTIVPSVDAATHARFTDRGRQIDRLWGAADMTLADMESGTDEWTDMFEGPLVA